MSKSKRPGTVQLPLRGPAGNAINREAPIKWLSPRIGFADVPTLVVGERIRVLTTWDGQKSRLVVVEPGSPLVGLVDALLLAVLDAAALHARIAKLEGRAAGDVAEEEANANPAPLHVLPPVDGTGKVAP